MSAFMLPEALKGQQWERAKGELRALVALQGAYSSSSQFATPDWERLSRRVEAFIKDIEGEGLQE